MFFHPEISRLRERALGFADTRSPAGMLAAASLVVAMDRDGERVEGGAHCQATLKFRAWPELDRSKFFTSRGVVDGVATVVLFERTTHTKQVIYDQAIRTRLDARGRNGARDVRGRPGF
jgi:hypothetical protein